ncbi:glycoside hydrolase family 61 protein [Schizophyllum commune H4-8]|uniref:lytic cellulose monooxygenase (C4-dehydrogenating) n=1 Tax=Schizophyllum commune (strain H4-8 / FGSC 9210) TaxID=578458 RepID=D8QHF7_SCHCM|nr:glycoside hydrolase family 61 protein [Schizophyllum commune H4-8]KAI5887167.1 glycoside hydrolase family 61 protein [Schizophyllum commune H4-8]
MRVPTLLAAAPLATTALAHYTLPVLVVNGEPSGEWVNIRRTNNYYSQQPVTDVTSPDFTCYTTETQATAETAEVAAGSSVSIKANGPMYHQGVVNVYMADADGDAASYDGSGEKWFKVYEIPAVTDGGSTIEFPGTNITEITFDIPKALPSGEYLVRAEHIALHNAANKGGAQFYLSCAQVKVTGGGNGTPGPLVSIPGVYDGNEPGIKLNIYSPIPANYSQPGPAVWSG